MTQRALHPRPLHAALHGGTLALLAALGLGLGLSTAGCGRQSPAASAPPEPKVEGERVSFPADAPQLSSLTVEAAVPRKLAITHLTGRLYWNDQTTVRIFTPVIGQVTAIRADIGQPVSAGTPLADISSPDYGQALADAQTATGNLAAAQKAFLRAKDLLEHGAAAAKDVEAAEAAFVAARAERDRAESRLKLYGGSESETGEAFVLHSPVAGVVVERNINPGQEVRNDQMLANAPNLFAPLFVVSDPALLWIQLDVSESDLPSLEPGLALRIHARAFPDRVFDGAVEKVGEEMDPSTRTVIVRGVVRNPDKLLKAEMYVLADVVQDESRVAKAGVEISSKAIFMVDNRNYLFVEVGPGQYERRQVSIGTEKDGRVPVLDGLSAGQKVVTEGGLLLQSILDPAD